MGRFFDPNSGVMGFMSKVADVIILSILWFLCSIPVVTMGAATAALYYTAVKVIRRERSYLVASFFKSFKENFIQGTLIWILFLLVMAVLGVNIKFCREIIPAQAGEIMSFVLMAVYSLMGLTAVFTALYMLPVLSRFTMKTGQLIKMSLFMSIRHLPYTFLLTLIVAALVVVTMIMPVAMFFTPAAGALLYSLPMERILKQYVAQEDKEKDGYKDEWYLE